MDGWCATLSTLYENLCFRYQEPGTKMMQLPSGILPLACDTLNPNTQKVCKQYGFVPSAELAAFVRTRAVREEQCLYTLVNLGQPCDGCLDVDVLIQPDDPHHAWLQTTLTPRFLCEKITGYVTRALERIGRPNEAFRLLVLDSSSPTKVSFHLHLVFADTCFAALADMGRFMWLVFSLIEEDAAAGIDVRWAFCEREHGSARLLQQTGANKMQTLIFDTAIYTKGRCFRLPHCAKLRTDGSLGPRLEFAFAFDSSAPSESLVLSDDEIVQTCRITRYVDEIVSPDGPIVCKVNTRLSFLLAIENDPTSDSRFLRYETPLPVSKWSEGTRSPSHPREHRSPLLPTLGLKLSKSIRVLPLPVDDSAVPPGSSPLPRLVFPFDLFF